VAAPMLGLGMLVGITVSILQAITQIQEQTLTFVPKIIAVMIAIIIFGPLMLTIITEFTQNLYSELPNFIN
jgi:flagellar biosynthetic protein FliQ